MNAQLAQVMKVLEAKFGNVNDEMTHHQAAVNSVFFNTENPRVKVCVQCSGKFSTITSIGIVKSIRVSLAIEDAGRPGMFFALGDRLHFDVEKFPEFKFHKDINAMLSKSGASLDKFFQDDVVAYAIELTEKIT